MAALLIFALSCGATDAAKRRAVSPADPAQLDDLERRTFDFFWQTANPQNGLVPDRWPTPSFSSIAAVGFGLTAYGIGAERGYVTREEAAQRVLTTLQFFLNAPAGPEAAGKSGYKGFFYHFLDMQTGARFKDVELSTIDTTLLLAGALFCQSYFDRDNPAEIAIRDAAEQLYRNADWTFFLARPPLISMGWTPEHGLHDWDWHGYNEAMILEILALGSPTHPVDPASWKAYTAT
ncbi:MAG: glucoamylase family protein, partial [Thermoanaerobaculia bacterium]